jgi:hypothetical protein
MSRYFRTYQKNIGPCRAKRHDLARCHRPSANDKARDLAQIKENRESMVILHGLKQWTFKKVNLFLLKNHGNHFLS